MAKISNIELAKLRQKNTSPDKAMDLVNQAAQNLAEFKNRITSVHDELTAISSFMTVANGYTKPEQDEVANNLAEIVIVKTAIDTLDL